MGLFKNELYKLFHTRSLYLFFGIILLFMALNVLGYTPGGSTGTTWTFTCGQSIPLALTEIYTQLMAFMVPLYAAGSFAGEYKQGTLKYTLLHPVGRTQLLAAKCAALLVFIALLTLFSVLAGYGLGTYQLGWGNSLEYGGRLYTTRQGIVMTVLSYLLLIPPCAAYGLFTVCAALLSGDTTAAILSSLGVSILGFNLNALPAAAPYSLFYHMAYLNRFFIPTFVFPDGLIAIGMLLLYFGIFSSVSILIFKKKDILH